MFRFLYKTSLLTGVASLCSLVISCSTPPEEPEPVQEVVNQDPLAKPIDPGTWEDPGNLTGAPKIVVNVAMQRAYFYKGNTLVGSAAVSTGRPGYGTPRGTYRVQEKQFVRYSGTFGVIRDKNTHEIIVPDFNTKKDRKPKNGYYEPARMPYCLRYHNGYCFHEGYVPGYPASHGCVRIASDMAAKFYENAKLGMTFIVK